jgi:hypothetical protein
MKDNTGGFQTFEFRLGNSKFFLVKAAGFCRNWGMSTSWEGLGHITLAVNRGKFMQQKFDISRHRNRNGLNRKGWIFNGLVT